MAGKVADAPMESVTTACEDGPPLETSAVDSAAGYGQVNFLDYGGDLDELGDDGETDAEGRTSAQSLATARAHLAAVAEELATIQDAFGNSPEAAAEAAEEAKLVAAEAEAYRVAEASKGEAMLQVIQELEQEKRHLEVDRDEANARADRVAQEKEELLGAQASMEADLRFARNNLEEAQLHLQHQHMDLRKKGGDGDELSPLLHYSSASGGAEMPFPMAAREMAEQAGLAPRPAIALSKQQAVAALRAAQAELRDERKRRERLERRVQKDQQRLERLVSVAETQQQDIRSLQMRCWQSEASAQECVARLQESQSHTSNLQMALQGPRPGSTGSNEGGTSPFGTRGMVRQQSAPTHLPAL